MDSMHTETSLPSPRQSGRSKPKKDGKEPRRGKQSNADERQSATPVEDFKASSSSSSSRRRSGGRRSSSTREREDRDAKRKAHSSNVAAIPGAHASTGEPKSSRKSGKGSSSSDLRSSKRDEKSAYRSTRADGSIVGPGVHAEHTSSQKRDDKSAYRSRSGAASSPGVQAEKSSSRSSKMRDEKDKERRTSRATKPGAEASTFSSDKSKSKAPVPLKIGSDDDALVAATVVEEENIEVRMEAQESRRSVTRSVTRSATNAAAETTRRQRELEAENQRLSEEIERNKAERNESKIKAKKRNIIICIAFVIVLICTGVGTYFAGQSSSSSDAVKQSTSQEILVPSLVPSAFQSIGPTDDPSTAPSILVLKYPEPSLEECQLIANGLKIQGEDAMFDRSFAVPMEVTLEPGSVIDTLLTDFEFAIEKNLVPNLIGCPRALFQLRRLGHHPAVKGNSSMSMTAHRQLEGVLDIRFVIARVIVDVTVNNSACKESTSPNCSVVVANMALKVHGDESIFLLGRVIGLVFPKGKDIQPDLELMTPFGSIVVADIQSTDATPAPTIAPTGTLSVSPSGFPSYSPSASPTSGPAIGPTTPAPIKAPTKSPSMAPSTSPSVAPTPTPRPTFAPQPGPSPPPTALPTKSPSIFPTKSPSSKPSLLPSVSPSNRVTAAPTSAPTDRPTFVPSGGPTLQPSRAATPQPTIAPSRPPSAMPVNPGLESDLYCGCTMDSTAVRDMSLGTSLRGASQLTCINYCKSQGYNFAGLQYVDSCFCGNSAGTYGNSINCFTQDRNRDGVYDVCNMGGPGACYDGSDSCSCGGANANTLFRTSQAVSCPPENPPLQVYQGCMRDNNSNRDVSVFGMAPSSIANCRNLCKDMGFVFSGVQQSNQCFCGNNYGNYAASSGCNMACSVDRTESGCGGTLANSVYWSGAALAIVPELEGNLYCGCMGDLPSQRDLEHLAPYTGSISQKACIHYCRGKGYDFAGLQSGSQCWCGNSPGTHSNSQNCNMPCIIAQEASGCYDGSSSCSCGGTNANSLFRTSASVSCPAGA